MIVEVIAPPTIVSLPVLPLRNRTVLLATTFVLVAPLRTTACAPDGMVTLPPEAPVKL